MLTCPKCRGRMKLVAMVTDPTSIRAYLLGIGEHGDVPERSRAKGRQSHVKIPKHARKELDAYLDCGLLCRGSRGCAVCAAQSR